MAGRGTTRSRPGAASAWPTRLLLDELWLRSRRSLVHALEARGLWPSDEQFAKTLEVEHATGEQLRDGILRLALGDADWELLVQHELSRDVERISARLPVLLAFGALWADGGAGGGRLGGRPRTACALFGLAIAMFETMLDSPGPRRQAVLEGFGEQALQPAVEDPHAWIGEPTGRHPELDVLRKLLVAVLAEGRRTLDPRAFHELIAILEMTVAAQLRSREDPEAGPDVARARAVLPYCVLHHLATAGASPDDPGDLANAYALLDDVVGLVHDLRANAANQLIEQPPEGGNGVARARALLEEDRIDRAAATVAAMLPRGLDQLRRPATGVASEMLRARHLAHIRERLEL